jgi:thiol:disulfide interchange protein DsbG
MFCGLFWSSLVGALASRPEPRLMIMDVLRMGAICCVSGRFTKRPYNRSTYALGYKLALTASKQGHIIRYLFSITKDIPMTFRTRLMITGALLATATPTAPTPATPAPAKAMPAKSATPGVQDSYKNLIQKVTQGQVQVLQQFVGPNNLVGLVVQSPRGEKAVIYVDKNAQYIVIGNVITADGQSQTANDTEKYVNTEIAQKAWASAASTAWVLDGSANAKHLIYAIADPNCSACHKFYTDTRPYVEKGDLAIRWILVGFLRPSSQGMAMAIINAKDPAALLKQNESQFNMDKEQGGIKPIDNPSADLKAKFAGNMKFMSDHQFTVTPTIIFLDAQGKAHTVMGALPEPQLKDMVNSAAKP